MYVGHVGAALAGKRARRSIGLLVLLVATYIPDWVDTGLCLAGSFTPAEMFSHSIPAVLLFALVGFAGYGLKTGDWTGASVIAVVIMSHMVFDWITGDKPTWPGGPMIGLKLYEHPILDFVAEGTVIAIGGFLYARTLPPRRRPWLDVSMMMGTLLGMQLAIDLARLFLQTLPKC
jgi:LexA-binding, inner membrane-associated putative hydrolase